LLNQTFAEMLTFADMKAKKPKETIAEMTELVLPNDTNTLGNLMGGRLMHWMDIVSAISAQMHCNRIVVTAAVDFVDFKHPIRLGEIVKLSAKVTRAFNTSMEVYVKVIGKNLRTGEEKFCNEAYFTFVAVDQDGLPISIPQIEPETEEEKAQFEDALARRNMRLMLAGKIKPDINILNDLLT
jgi:acyl-CoA hydrolase